MSRKDVMPKKVGRRGSKPQFGKFWEGSMLKNNWEDFSNTMVE